MVRYYKGKVRIEIISPLTPLKTVMVKSLDFGIMGQNNIGFKATYPNDLNICRIRDCWRKKK